MSTEQVNDRDKTIQTLLTVIKQKREEIALIDKPRWETNCNFIYESGDGRYNIQTISDPQTLVKLLGYVIKEKEAFDAGAKELGLALTFKISGYTVEQWTHDLKARLSKVNVSTKKKEMETLEARLNKLVTPAERERLELEDIMKSIETL